MTDRPAGGAPSPAWLWFRLALGPLLALVAWLLTANLLDPPARATAAVAALMAAWWMTEAIPLPATALIPLVAFPLLGVMPVSEAAAPYASHIIFLFMGGFMIGLAMQRWSLHRRVALFVVARVGTGPARLVGGFMLASALLSMWISNTATAIMLLPVGASVIAAIAGEGDAPDRNLGTGLMLGIAYGASIGGLGTLLGSPPNLFFASFAERELGVSVGMLDWMRYGLPAAAVLLPVAWWVLTRLAFPVRTEPSDRADQALARARDDLGPASRGEKIVAVVFCLAAVAWIARPQLEALPGLAGLSDAGIAMAATLALFVIPVHPKRGVFAMDWDTARDLPWGILLLFGGGLSLARGIGASGLDAEIAAALSALGGAPTWLLVGVVIAVVVALTELSSNTATASTFIPILAAVAAGLAVPALPVTLAVAMAASCAFMLPVATPPNAVVFSSGHVGIGQMARAGIWLNLAAVALLTGLISLFAATMPTAGN